MGNELINRDKKSRLKVICVADIFGREIMLFNNSQAGIQKHALPAKQGMYIVRVSTED